MDKHEAILNRFNFFDLMLGSSIDTGARYFIFAGMGWLLGYVLFKRRWFHRKIIAKMPGSKEVLGEAAYSVLTICIFGVVGAATISLAKAGWTQVYWKLNTHSKAWFWCSIVLAIFLHDMYFYWTHRLMHHPKLFRWFHKVHHQSTNPSPWAAYSFAPLEAIMQASIFPLVVLVIPIHLYAFALFMVWQITFNVLGHTGYEFHPRSLMNSKWKHFLNTPTNHIMHHEKMRGNYGLYFNIWDRLMGTNHADYEDRFREVTSRPAGLTVAANAVASETERVV
jgi:lathosterol oxidase